MNDKHYKHNPSEFEPLTIINLLNMPFSLGNVLKYLDRYRYKGEPISDLEKAKFYLENWSKNKSIISILVFRINFILNKKKCNDTKNIVYVVEIYC